MDNKEYTPRVKFSLIDLRDDCGTAIKHINDLLRNWNELKSSGDLRSHLDLVANRCEWLIRRAADALVETSKRTKE